MNKVVFTAYRKILKMARKVDESVPIRSRLACTPAIQYNHRTSEWEPIDVPRLEGWPDSKIFLDRLIRRLNSDRQFYTPIETSSSSSSRVTVHLSPAPHRGGPPTSKAEVLFIPPAISQCSTVAQAARALFETFPISTHHLTCAFGAIKELDFATKAPVVNPLEHIPKELKELSSHVSFEASLDVPHFNDVHVMFRGFSEDVRRQFHTSGDKTDTSGSPDGSLSQVASSTVKASEVKGEKMEHVCAPIEEPSTVQVLVTHPRLGSCFRNTVMLLVEHNSSGAVAVAINRWLLAGSNLWVPVATVIQEGMVHPIFLVHLKDLVLLHGGPVMSPQRERCLTVLHRVPGISGAIRVGETSIWVNGDLDQLKMKLDSGEASLNDFAVIHGFTGFGPDQLKGDIAEGKLIVATSTTHRIPDKAEREKANKILGDFLFELTDVSNQVGSLGEKLQPSSMDSTSSENPSSFEASEKDFFNDPARASYGTWASVFQTFQGKMKELADFSDM